MNELDWKIIAEIIVALLVRDLIQALVRRWLRS